MRPRRFPEPQRKRAHYGLAERMVVVLRRESQEPHIVGRKTRFLAQNAGDGFEVRGIDVRLAGQVDDYADRGALPERDDGETSTV